MLIKKKIKYVGFKYVICPSFLKQEKQIYNKKIKKIFLFFGGFDYKNIMKKVMKYFIDNNLNYILYLPAIYKKNLYKNKRIVYFDDKDIYKTLSLCDLAITAGGLIMFDVLNLKKPLITIPQYLHQKENIKKLVKKKCLININFNKNLYKNLSKNLFLLNDFNKRINMIKSQSKILSGNKTPKAIELIYNEYKKY